MYLFFDIKNKLIFENHFNKLKITFSSNFLKMKTILVDAVNTLLIPNHWIYQGMYELLESYPNPKIVLTNANQEQIQKFWLNKIPYELFTLSHKPEKTDPSYYQKLIEYYNFQIDDLVYFEHNPEAVKSAQSLGINTYHYDHSQKDLNALKEFLDKWA